MANQAAKKAAKAKQKASNTYKPILLFINAVYTYGYVISRWDDFSSRWSNIIGYVTLLALTWYAYISILDASSIATKSMKGEYGLQNESQALAGGSSLDLLGLVVLVQFGTAFVSSAFYWLLICIPIFAAYKGYGFAKGFMGGDGSDSNSKENFEDDATQDNTRDR